MRKKKSLNISFYNKGHGCLVLNLTFPQKAITIHLSSVFDPIPDLFKWIEKIGLSDLPAEITLTLQKPEGFRGKASRVKL